MKRFVLFGLVAGLVLAVGTAQALTLQPNVTSWQSWDVGDLNGDNTPYWDGKSWDYGGQANIGYWLTKTGAFGPSGPASNDEKKASPGTALPYLGNSGGSAITDVYFTATTPNWAAIKIEIAGLAPDNYFGIYKADTLVDLANLLQPGGGPSNSWKLLFTGSANPNSPPVIFTPPWQDFGFYLATYLGKDANNNPKVRAFFSQSTLASNSDPNKQHFAFFRATPEAAAYPAYYIGVEDLPLDSSDKDYQDMVVFVQAIPDASTFALFLSGLPALALLRRRKG